jgi:hypothetical protein
MHERVAQQLRQTGCDSLGIFSERRALPPIDREHPDRLIQGADGHEQQAVLVDVRVADRNVE